MAENNNEPQPQEQQSYPEAPPPSKGQRKALKVILIVLAVFFILGILGTALLAFFGAKIGENIIEDVTNTQIENNGDNVSFESDDGSSSFSVGAELPNDFPEIVPVFEPSELSSSSSAQSGDGKIWTASFITGASQAEVTSFYENEFSGDEWEVSSSFSGGGANQTHYVNEAEETRIGVIVQQADEDDGETAFTLSVTQSQE